MVIPVDPGSSDARAANAEQWAPRLAIGSWPTPVRDASALAPGLWMKDEGVCHPVYSGNKVRKLETLLAEVAARPRSERRIVTMGAVGSHHVLATAVHAAAIGASVEAILIPRPWSAHAEDVVRATLGRADLAYEPAFEHAAARFEAAERDPSIVTIPAGGSSVLGTLGWVGAGEELAAQVARGELPRPARIVLPLGTAGTVVGALLGCARAGLDVPIVGVRVVPGEWLTPERVHGLLDAVAARCGVVVDDTLRARLLIDDDWLGEGYGHATTAGCQAIDRARALLDLELETTYSGKALAAALHHHARADRARASRSDAHGPTLFWQTHHRGPLPKRLDESFDPTAFGWEASS